MSASGAKEIEARVRQLIEMYSADDACAAHLLCDQYHPDALAYRIISADLSARDVSYGELRLESEKFAGALRDLGVGPGDRVATLMGKSWAYLVTLMGIWRLGTVHVPLFTAFAPPAIALRLRGSGAKVVVCDAAQLSKLEPGEDIPADAAWRVVTTGQSADGVLNFDALMQSAEPLHTPVAVGADAPIINIYTSGTTGKPKGVLAPLRALAAYRAYMEFGFDLRKDDVFWCAADPGWAYGLYYTVIGPLTLGVRSLLLEGGFDAAKTYAVLAQQGVTNFAAAPTVYRSLRASDVPAPAGLRLRCASSAGEPLTPEVNDWAKQALGVAVHDHYGQTEAGMMINNHHHPLIRKPLKPGSMGQAMPGWTGVVLHETRDEIVPSGQVGRIAFDLSLSPLAWFKGYEGNPEKSAEKFAGGGQWYVTGDTGGLDNDGYFHFSARDDDVIIMAGYRIGPFEVESVLITHPDVVEAAVIAAPDEVCGEVIEAYVVLRESITSSPDLERVLQQWVKSKFASHAYPRTVHFVPSLPKTPSGKVQRFVLKQQRREELARETAAKVDW